MLQENKRLSGKFSSSIKESKVAKVTGVFNTLKECRKRLIEKSPNILLLGIDFRDGNGMDFCEEIGKTIRSSKF